MKIESFAIDDATRETVNLLIFHSVSTRFCVLIKSQWTIHSADRTREKKSSKFSLLISLIEELFISKMINHVFLIQILLFCRKRSNILAKILIWAFTVIPGFYQLCFASLGSDHSHGGIVQIPSFVQEPPSHVTFSNNTGAHLTCVAHGNPIPLITWLTKEGSIVSPVPGLRFVEQKYFCSFSRERQHFWHAELIFVLKGFAIYFAFVMSAFKTS